MGIADRYADGEWNFYCDLCGKKQKSNQGVKTWDNHYVCQSHKEQRNPQDFVRGVKETLRVPWVRALAPDTFQPSCDLRSSSPMADYGSADCATVGGNTNVQLIWARWDPNAIAGRAIAGWAVSGVTV